MSNYKFEYNGEEYEFESDFSEMSTPRWLRANRGRDGLDMLFTIIEEFGGDDVCAAVDDMTTDEFNDFSEKLNREVTKALKAAGKASAK